MKKKILFHFNSTIVPFALFAVIIFLTIPIGLHLYRSIPKQVISEYDSIFHQQTLPSITANKPGTTNAEMPTPSDIYMKTGPIGDTFGGMVGPFIALFAAFLTFLAFYIQYKANVQQRQDIELERFESKYFELINLHKANVDEISIANKYKGRKSFVKMYDEFHLCFYLCDDFNKVLAEKERLNLIELTRFSYRIFFFGIGPASEKQLKFIGKELTLFNNIKPFLEIVQNKYLEKLKFDTQPVNIDRHELNRRRIFNNHTISFKPFDGHISILAHYYRHLFQTVKYVADHKGFDENEKLSYLRIIRAQLSNHEQLMLYYNGVAMANDIWFNKEYFTRYKMIHNIPLPLADFGIKPEEHPKIIAWYEKGNKDLFEWE